MTDADIMDILTEVIRETFGDDSLQITPETTAADVAGWDSVAHVELLISVEERFGIRFTTGEAAAMTNVGHMAEFIGRHLDRKG